MLVIRSCSRPLCQQAAVATLTYVYSDSTVVLGPLAGSPEPHCYDLCAVHVARVIPPRGWDLIRLDAGDLRSTPSEADLEQLAAAVRQAAANESQPNGGRRGHLHVVPPGH